VYVGKYGRTRQPAHDSDKESFANSVRNATYIYTRGRERDEILCPSTDSGGRMQMGGPSISLWTVAAHRPTDHFALRYRDIGS